jgi:hypothetical protein
MKMKSTREETKTNKEVGKMEKGERRTEGRMVECK